MKRTKVGGDFTVVLIAGKGQRSNRGGKRRKSRRKEEKVPVLVAMMRGNAQTNAT